VLLCRVKCLASGAHYFRNGPTPAPIAPKKICKFLVLVNIWKSGQSEKFTCPKKNERENKIKFRI
jgi:hypothetical protein